MLALNLHPVANGDYVLYWMQQAQRVSDNPALALAVREANDRYLPLVVCFGVSAAYPGANARHMSFMLQSLQHVVMELRALGATVCVQVSDPYELALRLGRRAALVVVDEGYLRHQRTWRSDLADRLSVAVWQQNTEVLVEPDLASEKQQWSAATIRPRLWKALPLDQSLDAVDCVRVRLNLWDEPNEALEDFSVLLSKIPVDSSVLPVSLLHGGYQQAIMHLDDFITNHISSYHALRNDPSCDRQSQLSAYLHFGQISSREVWQRIRGSGAEGDVVQAFIEQLFIRRELAINYVIHQPNYDRWEGLPDWSRRTLLEHQSDTREVVYSREQQQSAQTDDPNWNAAMRELVHTGKMHGYMRMYWVKQMLSWCDTPQQAYQWATEWNDRYSLDGRDPNGYAGIGWCFGLHDRPWYKRAVFGAVRPMTRRGLESKFDMSAYIKRIDAAVSGEQQPTTT